MGNTQEIIRKAQACRRHSKALLRVYLEDHRVQDEKENLCNLCSLEVVMVDRHPWASGSPFPFGI